MCDPRHAVISSHPYTVISRHNRWKDTKRVLKDEFFHCCRCILWYNSTTTGLYFLNFLLFPQYFGKGTFYKATNISHPTIWYDATVAYFEIQDQYMHGTRGNPALCVDIQDHKRQPNTFCYFGFLLSTGGYLRSTSYGDREKLSAIFYTNRPTRCTFLVRIYPKTFVHSTCFERLFRSSSGVHTLLYQQPCTYHADVSKTPEDERNSPSKQVECTKSFRINTY